MSDRLALANSHCHIGLDARASILLDGLRLIAFSTHARDPARPELWQLPVCSVSGVKRDILKSGRISLTTVKL